MRTRTVLFRCIFFSRFAILLAFWRLRFPVRYSACFSLSLSRRRISGLRMTHWGSVEHRKRCQSFSPKTTQFSKCFLLEVLFENYEILEVFSTKVPLNTQFWRPGNSTSIQGAVGLWRRNVSFLARSPGVQEKEGEDAFSLSLFPRRLPSFLVKFFQPVPRSVRRRRTTCSVENMKSILQRNALILETNCDGWSSCLTPAGPSPWTQGTFCRNHSASSVVSHPSFVSSL